MEESLLLEKDEAVLHPDDQEVPSIRDVVQAISALAMALEEEVVSKPSVPAIEATLTAKREQARETCFVMRNEGS